jgi:hypothetical protein
VPKAQQDIITNEVHTLAATNALMGLDVYTRWHGDFSFAQGQGWFDASPFCPTDAGAADLAGAIFNLIQFGLTT